MNDTIPGARAEGSVLMDGVDIYAPGTDVVELRKRVGMVFQRPNPFPQSIFDNVAFGPRVLGTHRGTPSAEVVEKSLRAADLWDEVKDSLRQDALALSLGQQQRLCIARVVAVAPEVILMDEPCSALDPIATLRMEELMRTLTERYTIVIVTHNMQQAARVSDRDGVFLAERASGQGSSRSSAPRSRSSPARGTSARRTTSRDDSGRAQRLRRAQPRGGDLCQEKSSNTTCTGCRMRYSPWGRWRKRGRCRIGPGAEAPGLCARPRASSTADRAINERRYAIENEALTLIATQQPMAGDLRTLAAILEIATELERMADYAKGIANIALMIGTEGLIKPLVDIPAWRTRRATCSTAPWRPSSAGRGGGARHPARKTRRWTRCTSRSTASSSPTSWRTRRPSTRPRA